MKENNKKLLIFFIPTFLLLLISILFINRNYQVSISSKAAGLSPTSIYYQHLPLVVRNAGQSTITTAISPPLLP